MFLWPSKLSNETSFFSLKVNDFFNVIIRWNWMVAFLFVTIFLPFFRYQMLWYMNKSFILFWFFLLIYQGSNFSEIFLNWHVYVFLRRNPTFTIKFIIKFVNMNLKFCFIKLALGYKIRMVSNLTHTDHIFLINRKSVRSFR